MHYIINNLAASLYLPGTLKSESGSATPPEKPAIIDFHREHYNHNAYSTPWGGS